MNLNLYKGNSFSIVHIDSIVSQGVTMPLKCILDNGELVVVKYPCNNCGTIVLIREWIGACIGDIINIPIPEYGTAYLSDSVIEIGERICGDYTKDFKSRKRIIVHR